MAQQRQKSEWGQTASLMALLFNVNRDSRTQPATPATFNPYAPKPKIATISMREWKEISDRKSGQPVSSRPASGAPIGQAGGSYQPREL